jgi:hypothetical protein
MGLDAGDTTSYVAAALTRASRRLQKKIATAAPLALSLDRERDLEMEMDMDMDTETESKNSQTRRMTAYTFE